MSIQRPHTESVTLVLIKTGNEAINICQVRDRVSGECLADDFRMKGYHAAVITCDATFTAITPETGGAKAANSSSK